MRLDVTGRYESLRHLNGVVSISEFLYGPRVFVYVENGSCTIYPDHEYNKAFNVELSSDDFEKLLEKHISLYRITHARTPRYWGCFVYINNELLTNTNIRYRTDEGMYCVMTFIDDGTPMLKEMSDKLLEDSGIPHNPALFIGLASQAIPQIPILANTAKLAMPDHEAGIIVMREPPEHDESLREIENGPYSIDTYYVAPNAQVKISSPYQTPDEVMNELMTFIGPKFIRELHQETGVHPVEHPIKFKRLCRNYMRTNMSNIYNEYKRRVESVLGSNDSFDFDKELDKRINQKVNELLRMMEQYSFMLETKRKK
jgi:hypothetical protein